MGEGGEGFGGEAGVMVVLLKNKTPLWRGFVLGD